MQKIKCLFERDFSVPHKAVALPKVAEGCEWVANGEGVATRKFDGTCTLVRDGKLYARYDAKHGKTPPPDFEPAQPEPDTITGHWPGWIEVKDQPEYKYHREAWELAQEMAQAVIHDKKVPDGTYELCGPKVQANTENFPYHVLIKHGGIILKDAPRDYEGIKNFLHGLPIEGIVFHHPDGRMVKIRKKDFDYSK